MEIKGLRCFVCVYEAKGFAHAALLLLTTQSNVSARIRKLEAFVGEPLFYRMHRSIVPTAKGKKVYRHAKAVLARVDEAVKAILDDEAA